MILHFFSKCISISPHLLDKIKAEMLPLAETWSGAKLEHTSTYGIRRYTEGSWLVSHSDKYIVTALMAVHILSLQVYHPCDLRHLQHWSICEEGLGPAHHGQWRSWSQGGAPARGDGLV